MAAAHNEELVTLKTRVRRSTADKLQELADEQNRSLAGELRQAIEQHLDRSTNRKGDRR